MFFHVLQKCTNSMVVIDKSCQVSIIADVASAMSDESLLVVLYMYKGPVF